MNINGTINRIAYYNIENGYTVAVMAITKDEYTILRNKNHLIGNSLTIVGTFDRKVNIDEEYTLVGEFVKDPNYGLQFRFSSFIRKEMYSVEGIISYLSSDIFPGVGAKTAKLIVEKLGVDTLNIIYKDKSVLTDIGISERISDVIYQVVLSNKINEQIILFFSSYKLTLETCHRIIAKLGANAVEIVKENPYILMEKLDYFGFKKNDAFALALGIAKDSDVRLKAVILYVLKEIIYSSGNSYIEKYELQIQIEKFLGADTSISKERLDSILHKLTIENKVFQNRSQQVFDYNLYQQEIKLAQNIVTRLNKANEQINEFTKERVDEAYEYVSNKNRLTLNHEQKIAVKDAFTEPLIIITGGPGTGKSTIIKFITEMYKYLFNNSTNALLNVALLAPTGRAAKRLKEIVEINAQTIHRFLGYTGEGHFEHSCNNLVNETMIIVDETSMMDLSLAYQLFTSIPSKARIIIVGDVDQLPSVGPGQVLKDLIDTKEIHTIRLNKIHRQAENSQIIHLAHDINEGFLSENILEKFPDRFFIPTDNDNLIKLSIELIQRLITKNYDFNNDIQILAPMYRCKCGINDFNTSLQNVLNPLKDNLELKHLGQTFRVNDRVIQLVNRSDKNVMNGDIGIISGFNFSEGQISGLTVGYDFGAVDYTIEELEDLKLAYAISIHKSQGSEFNVVILPMSNNYFYMFKRKLIYTAATRAKKLLILIGDIQSLNRGITSIEINRRTILKNKIIEILHTSNKYIDDYDAAFTTLGEEETDLSPYDFEKKETSSPIDFIEIELDENDFENEK